MIFLGEGVYLEILHPNNDTNKDGSTSLTKPLSCPKREDVTALRCSEPLRFIVGGPSEVFAIFCGLGPPGDSLLRLTIMGYRLLIMGNLLITCRILSFFLVVSKKKRTFGGSKF